MTSKELQAKKNELEISFNIAIYDFLNTLSHEEVVLLSEQISVDPALIMKAMIKYGFDTPESQKYVTDEFSKYPKKFMYCCGLMSYTFARNIVLRPKEELDIERFKTINPEDVQ